MIIPDRKKAVTMILSKLNDTKTGEETPGVPMKNEQTLVAADQPLHAIAQDAISAFERKSPADLTSALKAFFAEMSTEQTEE
jgi:hypothetical protein